VLGARTCSINGSINGTSVFPGGVPAMQFLKGILSASQIQAISDYLNSGTVTGQQRYITACAGCHGADARGGRTGENVRGESAGDIREAIDDEREMRFLSCMPSSDIKAIGTYLRGGRRSGDRDHDD
jgi:mono/diheme cytochrome c family protein